jgi:iron complex outermembrane recepter protein
MKARLVLIRKLLVMFSITMVIPAFSQGVYLSGKVIDADGLKPLDQVFIYSLDKKIRYGTTNAQGEFRIAATETTLPMLFSKLGYGDQVLMLKVGQIHLVKMKITPFFIEEIDVFQKRWLEKGVETLPQISVDRKELTRHSSASLGDALASIDGVSFISTGSNIQLPVIHGLYGNRILVLNNGFKHGFQNWGSDHAPEIDVSGAERIMVVKGAAGVKYGPDALGGAVIIENNSLEFNRKTFGRVTSSFQTNGRGYGINSSYGEGRKKFSYHLGANFNQVGDRQAPDYNLTNTGAREYALQGGMRYRFGKWDAKVHFSMVEQDLGILRAAIGNSGPALIRNMEADIPTFIKPFSYDINEPNQRINHQMISTSLQREILGGYLQFRYAKQWNNRQEFDVRRNADLPILDLELETDDAQLEWVRNKKNGRNGSMGVQYLAQSNRNNPGTLITPFIPNYQSSRLSLYALEAWEYSEHLWELGLRYDHENSGIGGRDSRQQIFRDNFSFSNVTAALGHRYRLNKHTTISNNIGSGWRPPNMAELYSFGQHESQTTFGLLRYESTSDGRIQALRVIPLAESDVRSENSLKYTFDVDWNKNNCQLNLTSYANYIGNFIFARPIGVLGTARGPMPTFIIDQANALFLGSDLTYSKAMKNNAILRAGGSYIWTRNVERQETLINQPPIHLHLQWQQNFFKIARLERIEYAIRPTYTFRQFQAPRFISVRSLVEGDASLSINDPIFDFQEAPPGYFLLNAYVHLFKGPFELNIEVRNILNSRYRNYLNSMRYFADELGINALISLTFKFQ